MGSRVLIIGGTGFVGRHLVDACLERGHEVTLFNRDRRPGKPLDDVRHIVGDRQRSAPAGDWDVVIDTCAYAAQDMSVSRLLSAHRYILLSTCGVYRAAGAAEIADEWAPVDLDGPARGKLDCERMVAWASPQSLIVRLGAVTGPGDPSGRLAYWVDRCLRGEQVLVPADREQPVQLVDVRDVAVFLASAVESALSGVVNVAGPVTTFERLLHLVAAATGSRLPIEWLPESAVLGHGVRPWREVPLWLPVGDPYRAHMRTGTGRAAEAGFAPRPFAETVDDTAHWFRANRTWHPDWLPLRREQAILAGRG